MTRTTPFSNRTTSVSLFSGRFWSVGVPNRRDGENIADYSPFGVLPIAIRMDGRSFESEVYRRGFNVMSNDTWISSAERLSGVNPEWSFSGTSGEKDDEMKGGGNSYTTFFRQLDPRVGRWFSVDPVKKSWESPYVSMENKPITFFDPKGDDIIGTSEKSAQRAQQVMLMDVFVKESYKDFKSLIVLDSDYKTFKKIDKKKFEEATKNLKPDEKALALGYFKAIDDDKKHFITIYSHTDNLSSNDIKSLGAPNASKATFLESKAGGGLNFSIEDGKSDKTIILMNSKAVIGDAISTNYYAQNVYMKKHTSSVGELLSHELIGHGLTRYNGYSGYNTWKNAILMTNLYLRVNNRNVYRDGSHHENSDNGLMYNFNVYRMGRNEANELPSYLK